MIAFLQGTVQEINKSVVIVLVNGVGYEVYASSKTQTKLILFEEAKLWIYTHVREDSLKLFGFSDLLEKQLFLAFIGINGIGPKMALVILSATVSVNKLLEMIEHEDINGLTQLPRVGKKSAQQIVISLKGKIKTNAVQKSDEQLSMRKILTTSLLHLGFRHSEITSALDQRETENKKIGDNLEEELKKVLTYLQPVQ